MDAAQTLPRRIYAHRETVISYSVVLVTVQIKSLASRLRMREDLNNLQGRRSGYGRVLNGFPLGQSKETKKDALKSVILVRLDIPFMVLSRLTCGTPNVNQNLTFNDYKAVNNLIREVRRLTALRTSRCCHPTIVHHLRSCSCTSFLFISSLFVSR